MEKPAPPPSLVYTWEPSNQAIAARYGLDPAAILRFDTNTSPASPAYVAEVLTRSPDPPLNEYPDSSYAELSHAAAEYAGVDRAEIVVGAGADEVLDLAARAFLAPGAGVLLPAPTYGMYAVLSAQRGARAVTVPRQSAELGFRLDIEKMLPLLPDVAVAWLCSPNNPTGASEHDSDLTAILDAAGRLPHPPLVVVDEAYHEFTGRTLVPLRHEYPHLFVVRTVSKAFALAGIRVGFGIAARPTIERLERVRPPGSIGTLSAALATEAIRRPELARANVERISAERAWLANRLAAAGWRPYTSVTNFLLLSIGDHAAASSVAQRLLRSGIVPRDFQPPHPLDGHLRLTVRSRGENQRLLAALGRR